MDYNKEIVDKVSDRIYENKGRPIDKDTVKIINSIVPGKILKLTFESVLDAYNISQRIGNARRKKLVDRRVKLARRGCSFYIDARGVKDEKE